MKRTTGVTVDDVFNALLFGLPQGILLGLVWIAYSAWTMRGGGVPLSPLEKKNFTHLILLSSSR